MDKKTIRHKLCNDFPYVYIRDINTALATNNYSYVGSYYYLEEQIKTNGLVLKKKTLKKKEIDSDTLTKFETIFNSVKATIECSCCCDDKPIEEFGQCSDGHLICKKCIKTHAENTIYQQLSCKVNCIDCNSKCFGR
jgi:hypothetical protein